MSIAGAILAVALIGGSAFAIFWHRRAWRRQEQRPDLSDEDRTFYHRQYRRRMQLSLMLGLCGAAVFVGTNVLSPKATPRLFIVCWCAILLLLVWITLLAAGDLLAIRNQTRRDLQHISDQQHLLRAQLRALRKESAEDEHPEASG